MSNMAENNLNVFETTPVKQCPLCSDTGDFKKAVKYCIDCGSHLCCKCLKHHSRFPLFKSHKVLDNLEYETIAEDENTKFVYCASHHGQAIESYCKDHDVICCVICVSIKHRSCENVTLEEAETTEVDKTGTKERLDTSISRLMLEKQIRSNNITELDEEKINVLNEIDSFQEKIIQKIKKVADASREEVRSKHEELVNAVKQDIRQLETVASVTEESLKTLSNCTSQIKSKSFLSVKKCEQVVKDAEMLVEDLPCKWPIRKLDYCIDYDSPHNDTTLKTFGHFIDDENKPSILLERYNGVFDVKLESDERNCVVSGICFLEDGMYGISDFANHKLKRFSKTYELYDSIDLDGGPSSACVVGSQEVALTLCNEKMIQFISCTGTLSLGNSFSTEKL